MQRVHREYEIDIRVIEALNSVEKRAAIETGQEVDRSDINMRMGLADQAAILAKAFALDELEAMDARIEAARKGAQVIEAPALAVPEVQPVPDQTHTRPKRCRRGGHGPGWQRGKAGPGSRRRRGRSRTECS